MCHALLMVLVGKLEWECIHLIVFVVPDQITKWLFCMYMYVIQNKVSDKTDLIMASLLYGTLFGAQ